MGLAASQARMLSLTSRKASLERDVTLHANRKMALSREMSELSQEYYDLLSDEKIMFLNDNGEYKQISYKYFMGVPGGVQNDINVKSDNSMLLFDTESGKVILSTEMANLIGPAEKLKSSDTAIYEAITRLCGDTTLAPLPDLNLPISYNLCADPELIKAICSGKYDSFTESDLTDAISKYKMKYYANDISIKNLWVYGGGSGKKKMNEILDGSNLDKYRYCGGPKLTGLEPYTKYQLDAGGNLTDAAKGQLKNALKEVLKNVYNHYKGIEGLHIEDAVGAYYETALENTVNKFMEKYTSMGYYGNTSPENGVAGAYYHNNSMTAQSDKAKDSDNVRIFYIGNTDSGGHDGQVYIDYSALMDTFIGALHNSGNVPTNEQLDERGESTEYGKGIWNKEQPYCPKGNCNAQYMDSFRDLIADVKFYFPIVTACARFGYTTNYDASLNDSEYIDSNLQNGVFQIMGFDTFDFALDANKDTDYYLLASELSKMNDPDTQAQITAWYESEKADLTAKETYWDTMIENLSAELNSITTEIESVQSLIDDAIKKTFDWGGK